jgi:hypothetical protein
MCPPWNLANSHIVPALGWGDYSPLISDKERNVVVSEEIKGHRRHMEQVEVY